MVNSCTKGKRGENEVCNRLRIIFPDVARDLDQFRGSNNGRDLVATEPFCVQVKRYKKVTPALLNSAYLEALKSCDLRYRVPMVVFRGDRQTWRVLVGFEDLAEVLGWSGRKLTPARIEMRLIDFVTLFATYQEVSAC